MVMYGSVKMLYSPLQVRVNLCCYILPVEIVCSSAKSMLVRLKFHIVVWEQLQNVSDEVLGHNVKRKFICSDFNKFLFSERPLSSRYANCSEMKKFVEVLMQKAIESDEFLEFAPCLIKMTAGMALLLLFILLL